MNVAWSTPAPKLTDSQRDQLLALHYAGAFDRETAIGPFSPFFRRARCGCNPNLLGQLRELGLSKSRVVRAGAPGNTGGQYTAYWLTKAGQVAGEAYDEADQRSTA